MRCNLSRYIASKCLFSITNINGRVYPLLCFQPVSLSKNMLFIPRKLPFGVDFERNHRPLFFQDEGGEAVTTCEIARESIDLLKE